MIKHKAYKFRIYPTERQIELLDKTFGCCRFVYNYYLDKKITMYKEEGISFSYNKCSSDLTSLKKENQFLKEVDSIALQQSLRHLDTAYKNFFKNKKFGFPKFKSKKNHAYSYTTVNVNGNIKLTGNRITLPKIGNVRIVRHRDLPPGADMKSVTVSKTPSGKYFVSISFEYEADIKPRAIEKSAGLDFSMGNLFVSSNGNAIPDINNIRYYKNSLTKLRHEQKSLSRKKKGSKRYEAQRIKVARLHEKVQNQRKDYLHKLSKNLTDTYDAVFIEDLNMKAMSRSFKFGQTVADNSWGMFTGFLQYKLEDQGKTFLKVGKLFPSSKTCSTCGYINKELKLKDRSWTCPDCGAYHNRDLNAAINIKNEGLRLLSL